MTQLIFHAGLPKTATTSIQTALHKNRSELDGAGVNYLRVPALRTLNLTDQTIRQQQILHTLPLVSIFKNGRITHPHLKSKTDAEIADYANKCRRHFEVQLGKGNWQTALFSSEALSNFSENELADLYSWSKHWADDIRVILYLRDPIKQGTSVVQQLLKMGIPFENILGTPAVHRWDMILQRMFSVFGKENVIVKQFEEAVENENGIIGEFLECLGLSDLIKSKISDSVELRNASLSLEAVQVLIHAARNNNRVHLGFARRITGRKFELPLSAKQKIYDESRSSVEFIEKELGISRYSYDRNTLKSLVEESEFESNGIYTLLDALNAHGFDIRKFIFPV